MRVPTWMLFVCGFLCNGIAAFSLWTQGHVFSLVSAFLAGVAFLGLLSRSTTAVRTADKDTGRAA